MPSESTRIGDLLDQWEEAILRGESLTPESLCADCPELLPELQEQIKALQSVDQRLTDSGSERELLTPSGQRASYEATFTNLQLLARGGLGIVYTGQDERLHRQVALKFLRHRLLEDQFSQDMFALEAEITSRLEHPGVVPVYGMGESDDGRAFYAMRFIQGETLDDALARFHQNVGSRAFEDHSRAFRQLLSSFISVCNTIAYAHNRGILHRDIKPANVMLGRYGETLVVDWGLAMPVNREARFKTKNEQTLMVSGSSRVHSSSGQVGTPAYMSPEQVGGQQQLSPATDIYALGATLYKLLTGRTPFDAPTLPDMNMAIVRGEFPPPTTVRPGVPRALEAICQKAMALRPIDRYGTALEMAEDVERYLADDAVSAHSESVFGRAARWARRHRGLTRMAGAASVLLVLAGFGLSAWMASVAGEEAAANAEAQRARQQTQVALDEVTAAEAGSIATALQYQIEEKLSIVEQASRDPELIRLVEQALAAPEDRTQWTAVNDWLTAHWNHLKVRRRFADTTMAVTLNDGDGTQIARAPRIDPTTNQPFESIGQSFKYRQYFRGGRPAPPQEESEFAPIRESFISAPYRSVNDDRPLMGFTAPIWSSDPDRRAEPLGVLALTVAVYDLTSLDHLLQTSTDESAINLDQVLTIVYAKPDFFDGKAERDGGLIMQHPAFKPEEDGGERPPFRPTYLADELIAQVRTDESSAISLADYQDPLAAVDPRYEGHWSAAVAPVSLEAYEGRDGSLAEPGWCVIVQRRVESATTP